MQSQKMFTKLANISSYLKPKALNTPNILFNAPQSDHHCVCLILFYPNQLIKLACTTFVNVFL
jgi:hypothetical protein